MRGDRLRRVRRGMGIALLPVSGVAVWLASAGAASAASSGGVEVNLPAHGTGFTAHPTAALLDVSGMAPGTSAHGIMGVRNDTGGVATLTISFDDIVSSENGCTLPELALPEGCSPGGRGQLEDHLVFDLATADRQHGRYVPRWTGSAVDLGHGVQVISRLVASGTEWVRLSVTLPYSSGNSVESDTFGFGLLVVLQGGEGIAGVRVRGSGPDGAQIGLSGLSDTGVPIRLIILVAEAFAAAGVGLTIVGRRRRDQLTSP